MTSLQIQLIADNSHLRSLLSWHLQQEGYRVFQATGARQSMEQVKSRSFGASRSESPSLVILDSELSDGSILELCHWLCENTSSLVMILSAKSTESDVVAGLRAGADDYLAKPFGMQEFLARVEALVRRTRSSAPPASLRYGDLEVDLIQRHVRLSAQNIDLTPQEFSLLYVLVQAGGVALSRTDILQRAWPDGIDNPRTVDTHILSLRKKLEVDPRQPSLVQTVRNVGYRFNLDGVEGGEAARMALAQQAIAPIVSSSVAPAGQSPLAPAPPAPRWQSQ
ncbi:MAG: response regulator transcription factor [Synechococcales cyanobacterium RU_4_20]|nr:response regulator transcription factor [Synechococcales cyanobacterium RU_4_20]NJR70460.1 response regulator transcription factor [Synechococcales cyanobacterium CRU_2_2]